MGGPATMLDANRSDPFESFRIVGGRRGHQLWDHGKFGRLNVSWYSYKQFTMGHVPCFE
jgi:hypothetical protein